MVLVAVCGTVIIIALFGIHYYQHFRIKVSAKCKSRVGLESYPSGNATCTRDRRNGIVDAHMNLHTEHRRSFFANSCCCCTLDSADGEEFDFFPIAFLVYIGWMAMLSIFVVCAELLQDSSFAFEQAYELNPPGHHSMDESHRIGGNDHAESVPVMLIDYVLIYGVMLSSLAESFFSFHRYYTSMMVSRLLINVPATAVCKRFSLYMALFCVLFVCAMHLYYFVFPLILVLFTGFNVFCVVKFSLDLLLRLRPLVGRDPPQAHPTQVLAMNPNEELIRSVIFMRNISLVSCLLRCICLAFFLITYNVDAIYLLPMLWAISALLFGLNFIRNRRCVRRFKIQCQQRVKFGPLRIMRPWPNNNNNNKLSALPSPKQPEQELEVQVQQEEQQDEMPSIAMHGSMFKKKRKRGFSNADQEPLSKADTLSQKPFELEVIHPQNSLTEEKSYTAGDRDSDDGGGDGDMDDNKSEPPPNFLDVLKQKPPVLVQRSAPLYDSNVWMRTALPRPASMDTDPVVNAHRLGPMGFQTTHSNSLSSSRSTSPRAAHMRVPLRAPVRCKIRVPEKPKALLLLGIDTPISYGTPSFPTPSKCEFGGNTPASTSALVMNLNLMRADSDKSNKSNTLMVPSPKNKKQSSVPHAPPIVQKQHLIKRRLFQSTSDQTHANMKDGAGNTIVGTSGNAGSRSAGFGEAAALDFPMTDCLNANDESVSREHCTWQTHDLQNEFKSSEIQAKQPHMADVSRSLQSFQFLAKQGLMHRSSLRSVQEFNIYQTNFETRKIQLDIIADAV